MSKIEMDERALQVVITATGNQEFAHGKAVGRRDTLQLMDQAMTWCEIPKDKIRNIKQLYHQLEQVDKL